MYQSLVHKHSGRVAQIVKGGTEARFEVHEDFIWVDGPSEVDKGTDAPDYFYEDLKIKRRPAVSAPYDLSRKAAYDALSNQLDMLYHDMEQGIIPGKEQSSWFAHVKSVKENYPKP